MPTATYEELLIETLPTRIEDDQQAAVIGARFNELAGKNRRSRSTGEQKLMDLLGVLIQDYDRRNALPPEGLTPSEMIQFCLGEHGKTPEDLLPIFRHRSE